MVLLNWARTKGWVHASPKVKQLPIERKREILPNKYEVAQIIDLLPNRLQALVLVLACTGFRRGEVFNLPWHHVDLEKGTFEIAAHRDWKPKTPRSERVFKFTGRALEAVRALPRDGYYVFPGKKEGNPINNFRKALATAVDKFVKRGGRDLCITPKTFRKAFASWQAEQGTPEIVTQDLLGHVRGSRVTKEVYTHLPDGEYLKALIDIPLPEQPTNETSIELATIGNRPRRRGNVGS